MSQITSKWITDGAITPAKLDSSGSFTMTGLRVLSDATVGGDLQVLSDATVGGNLEVNGNVSIVGDLTFDDATVDTLDVLTQLNANYITGTDATYRAGTVDISSTVGNIKITSQNDSSYLATNNMQVFATNQLSVIGLNDATFGSAGNVTLSAPFGTLDGTGNDILFTSQNDSSYLATNNMQVYAGNQLSVIGLNDATFGSAGNITLSAPFGTLDGTANDILFTSQSDSSYLATNNMQAYAANRLSLIGLNDATLGSAGNVTLSAPYGTLDGTGNDIIFTSQNDSSYLATNNMQVFATNQLSVIGLNDATLGSAGNITLSAPYGTLDGTGNDILFTSQNDSSYLATNNMQVFATNRLSLIGLNDATFGSAGNAAISAPFGDIKLHGAGVDINCLGPVNVQAYDGSDAFQLTGGAGDFILKQASGVNQVVSQTAPLEIKTLGSQDMTVWPQRNLRLWTPGGNLVADATPNILFTSSNDSSYLATNNMQVYAGGQLSLIGLNDATFGSAGNARVMCQPGTFDATANNITFNAANDSTYSASNKVGVYAGNTLSLVGLGDATLGSVGNVYVSSAGNVILTANRVNIPSLPGPYNDNAAALGGGLVAGDLYYDSSDPRGVYIAY